MKITLDEARRAFALWWKEYTDAPETFSKEPDMEGKDSAELFFAYVENVRALK